MGGSHLQNENSKNVRDRAVGTMFLAKKKDGRGKPVFNLEFLSVLYHYQHGVQIKSCSH